MKFVTLSLITIFVNHVTLSDILLSSAIDGILNEFFAKISPKIDIVYVGDQKDVQSETLIDGILKKKNDSLVFKVTKHNRNDSVIKLNTSSIVILDSVESFRKICNKIAWQTNPTVRHQHLVYSPGVTLSDLELIRDGFIIDTVNFVVHETDNSIKLVSGFMFTSKKCRKNQFVTINNFSKSSMEWETSNFYPNKYRNLHQCELKFGVVMKGQVLSSSYKALHIFIKFINSTPLEFLEAFDNKTSDVSTHSGLLNMKNEDNFVPGYTYDYDVYTFLIPPGELFTPLEKMFLPFDDGVWIGICVTLLFGFVAIQVVNRSGENVRNFVFGRTVKTPTMNMVSVLMNGFQVKTAGRNFARFIFILFVVWALIIRTCYQSKIFEYLQADPRKPELQTIEELFENNFTIFEPLDPKFRRVIEDMFQQSKKKATKL